MEAGGAQRHVPREQPGVRYRCRAIRRYWGDDRLATSTRAKGQRVAAGLEQIVAGYPEGGLTTRGRGLVQGLVTGSGRMADQISAAAFERGL